MTLANRPRGPHLDNHAEESDPPTNVRSASTTNTRQPTAGISGGYPARWQAGISSVRRHPRSAPPNWVLRPVRARMSNPPDHFPRRNPHEQQRRNPSVDRGPTMPRTRGSGHRRAGGGFSRWPASTAGPQGNKRGRRLHLPHQSPGSPPCEIDLVVAHAGRCDTPGAIRTHDFPQLDSRTFAGSKRKSLRQLSSSPRQSGKAPRNSSHSSWAMSRPSDPQPR